jgi:hypothetical protein
MFPHLAARVCEFAMINFTVSGMAFVKSLAACGAAGLMAAAASATPPPNAKTAPQMSLTPPEAPKSVKAGQATRSLSLEEISMGGLVIEFGRTRLEDVRKSAGGAVATRAGAAQRHLCYTPETGRRIWVSSDAMGGEAVSAFTLVAQAGMAGETACPGLPPRLTPGGDIGGVSLGQKRADVEAELGQGGGGEWARYEACSVLMKRCSALTLRYVNNRVMQITASQTTVG